MPYEETSSIHHVSAATKQVDHGKPAIEAGFSGVAFKTEEPDRWTAPASRKTIIVGESFDIRMGKIVDVAPIPGGSDVGDPLWIRHSDNAILVNPGAGGTNEIQVVTLTSATGGTFTLTFNGQTTAAIAFNAAASAVQSALEALSNIAPGDVAVTGSAGGPYTVTFGGHYLEEDVAQMTADNTLLTGAGHAIAVTTSQAGAEDATSPFGRVERIDTILGVAKVNTAERIF